MGRPSFAPRTDDRCAAFAVLEPDSDGHRLMYVAKVARRAEQAELAVRLLLSRRDIDKPEVAHFAGSFLVPASPQTAKVVLVEDPSARPDIAPFLATVLDGERVMVLDADRYLHALVRRGLPHGSVLLLMRARMSGARGTSVALMKFLLVTWLRLRYGAHVYRLSATIAGRDAHPLLRKLPFVVDPVPVPASPIDERAVLAGLPKLPERYLLVAGRLDARKSIPELADWAGATRHRGTALVLAGRLDPQLTDRVRPSSSVVLIDRFMSDEELVVLYRRCTAVACLYENEGPAGAVTFARSAGRPVIVWGSRQAAAQADEAGLLVLARGRTGAALDEALDLVLNRSAWLESATEIDRAGEHRAGSHSSNGLRGNADEYAAERFASRLLGLPDAPVAIGHTGPER